jgi:hypothetical protein
MIIDIHAGHGQKHIFNKGRAILINNTRSKLGVRSMALKVKSPRD